MFPYSRISFSNILKSPLVLSNIKKSWYAPVCFTINSDKESSTYFTQAYSFSSHQNNLQYDLLKTNSSIFSSIRQQSSEIHDHSKLWVAERLLSGSLLAAMPLSFIMPNKVTDSILAIALCLHVHWGIEAIVVDYIRPSIFGSLIPKLSLLLVYLLSGLSLAGLLYFNYDNVGLTRAIRMIFN